MLTAAMLFAVVNMLLAAMGGIETAPDTTHQIRVGVSPMGVIKRMMPPNGTIYFGIDFPSFTHGNISRTVTESIKHAAIGAATHYSEQNLGISFAYTEDQQPTIFEIRYDANLDRGALAASFFPWEWPYMRYVLVSSFANDPQIFRDYNESMVNVFDHEFGHILGLRHYDAGSDPVELSKPSALWPGTRDGDRNTIMLSNPSQTRLFDEDFRVIREFYSMEEGALVDGVRISDINTEYGPPFVLRAVLVFLCAIVFHGFLLLL